MSLRFGWLTAVLVLAAGRGFAAPVVLVSVDGMKPEYVTDADAHGLKVPFLRSMMVRGAWAAGVTGVLPTITYPSHTTLLTGVTPAEHGILANTVFDPEQRFDGAWSWYARDVRVPTLWNAAHAAGLKTASVGWPVSVGADVDWLIPEYWRGETAGASLAPGDRELIAAISRPVGMLDEMQARLGPYMRGNETTVEGDEIKTRYAIDLIRAHHPGLLTLHLSSLDETEHETGPFSAASNRTMEAIDGMLGQIEAAAQEGDPAAVMIVVSDHGFVPVSHHVNLRVALIGAGLIRMSDDPKPEDRSMESWKVQAWGAGGTFALMLHNPDDAASAAHAGAVLRRLARDPANGIAEVVDHAQAVKMGGFPDAAWVVLLRPEYYAGDGEAGPLVTPIEGAHGGHGFDPRLPEMRSSFFAMGATVAPGKALGQVNMLQIAPTVARMLGLSLPAAKAQPLEVGR